MQCAVLAGLLEQAKYQGSINRGVKHLAGPVTGSRGSFTPWASGATA